MKIARYELLPGDMITEDGPLLFSMFLYYEKVYVPSLNTKLTYATFYSSLLGKTHSLMCHWGDIDVVIRCDD